MLHLMKTSLRKKMRMRKKFKITLSWKLMIKFSHWLRTNLHKPLNLLLSMLFYPLCQFIQKNNLAQFHLVSPFSTFFPPRPGLVGTFWIMNLFIWRNLPSLFEIIDTSHVIWTLNPLMKGHFEKGLKLTKYRATNSLILRFIHISVSSVVEF